MKQTKIADLMFFCTLLIWIFASYLIALIPWSAGSYIYRILLSQILLALPVGIGLFAYRKVNPEKSLCDFLGLKKIRILTVLLFLLISVFIRPLLTVLNAVSMLFVENVTSSTLVPVIGETSIGISLLTIALIPCLFEELVYRGYFYHSYRKLGFWRGALFSALIFGMMHMNFNQFAYAFCMGIIFCIMAEASGSIWGGILVHFCINGSSVLMVWLLPKLQQLLTVFAEKSGMELGDLSALTDTTEIEYSAAELLPSIRLLLVPTLFMTVIAAFLIYAVACLQNRRESFMKAIRGSKEQTEEEGSDAAADGALGKAQPRIPGPLYFVSALLCLGLMLLNTM